MTVNLSSIVQNWRKLDALSAPARAACVVKADAYGLGALPVVKALYTAGCRDFFVAFADEGAMIRPVAPEARVFVLSGAFAASGRTCLQHRLIPLLGSVEDVRNWISEGSGSSPFGLNIDTGMNRLGLTIQEALDLSGRLDHLRQSGLCHIMSHLACADDQPHPKNSEQLEHFQRVRTAFCGIESSFCNSAGIFLGGDYLCNITRPGIALYGGEAVNDMANPMRVAVTAETKIVQIRQAKSGETVSYGGAVTLRRDTAIAVCATGYADGYPRSCGAGVLLRSQMPAAASGFVASRKVQLLGRVTMDMMMFDVTDVPDSEIKAGDYIELFGPNVRLDDAARSAGTIGYELLTSLGKRYHRRYVSEAV